MMDPRQAYNIWASQYDTNPNKTRDLEALALRAFLANITFNSCLEIGCGTGKNTVWLMEGGRLVTAVDQSEEMLLKAKEKITLNSVQFIQFNIKNSWTFKSGQYDIVTFSLVLEHIDDLDHIFKEASASLKQGGYVYIGELHPYKQYNGSKARFDTEKGTQVVECFNHHVSDFIEAGKKYGLSLTDVNEYFDNDDRNEIPRILTILLRKL